MLKIFQDCGPCRAPDCGVCVFCLDKPKFGGRNKKRGACLQRKCLKMSLAHTKVTPAQRVESEEGGLVESGEEQEVASDTSTGNESVETTMNDEDVDAVKHDHCYSLQGEANNVASKDIDLWCYESLGDFMAETMEVQHQRNSDLSIRNISETEETDLVPPPVYYKESQKGQMKKDGQNTFKGEIKLNPRVKRIRRNF